MPLDEPTADDISEQGNGFLQGYTKCQPGIRQY